MMLNVVDVTRCISKEWISDDLPRVVLNKLETLGYRVQCMTGVGQTCIWTCYKPAVADGVKSEQ